MVIISDDFKRNNKGVIISDKITQEISASNWYNEKVNKLNYEYLLFQKLDILKQYIKDNINDNNEWLLEEINKRIGELNLFIELQDIKTLSLKKDK